MRSLIREPLFHFLVLGLVLFWLVSVIAPRSLETESPMEIVISEDKLTNYLQFQRKSFKPKEARAMLQAMSQADQNLLIDNYVRDEALYREALSLGLDDNDEIIRRRLIQKMEYIAQGFYNELPVIDEAGLQGFFKQNQEQYLVDPAITFTHVYFSKSGKDTKQGTDESSAKQLAQQTLQELNDLAVPFAGAGKYGDRFLYNLNYVERTPAYTGNHFGKSFANNVFEHSVSNNWQGPIESEYGYHLVLIKEKTAARLPPLSEVAGIVLADAQREQQRQTKVTAVNTLVKKYTISNKLNDASDYPQTEAH